jgi:hypothetical protein
MLHLLSPTDVAFLLMTKRKGPAPKFGVTMSAAVRNMRRLALRWAAWDYETDVFTVDGAALDIQDWFRSRKRHLTAGTVGGPESGDPAPSARDGDSDGSNVDADEDYDADFNSGEKIVAKKEPSLPHASDGTIEEPDTTVTLHDSDQNGTPAVHASFVA